MSDYIEHLREVFEVLGPVRIRRMFGGHGIFHEGLMFALVADDVVYLKADAESLHHFTARGLAPFSYMKQGRAVELSYRAAPDEMFDDTEEAARWSRLAFDAALRSQAKSRKQPTWSDTP
jgi:DNA transformation protein